MRIDCDQTYHLGAHVVDIVLDVSTDDKNAEGNCFHFIIPDITS